MKELKSKKTGLISIVSDEEFYKIRNSKILSRFIVTDIKTRTVIPVNLEDSKPKKKKE